MIPSPSAPQSLARISYGLRATGTPTAVVAGVGLVLAVILLATPGVHAVTIRVPGDAPTIQAALDSTAAIPDVEGFLDTVLVAPGVYTGPGNRNLDFSLRTSPFPNDIVVRSEGGAAVTILDVAAGPDDNARGFTFRSGESRDAILEGFTIRNGWMGGSPDGRGSDPGPDRRHELSGAGIVVRFFTSPTIRDCVIESCFSEYSGGGVETEFGAEPLFERCVIRGNESAYVGGGGSFEMGWEARPELRHSVITGNLARVSGGGIYSQLAIELEGCLVAGNRSPVGGGITFTELNAPVATRTILWGNCSDGDGNLFVGAATTVTLACSAVDTTAMTVEGSLVLEDAVVIDPIFCDPSGCGAAPTVDGDYRLAVNSPCLDLGGTCEGTIGPHDVGCGVGTPVRALSWGRLRQWFGARSDASR